MIFRNIVLVGVWLSLSSAVVVSSPSSSSDLASQTGSVQVLGAGNQTGPTDTLGLSEPLDPKIQVHQYKNSHDIPETAAYMTPIVAMAHQAYYRWSNTVSKAQAWAWPRKPGVTGVRVQQGFNNPIANRILFTSLVKVFQGFSESPRLPFKESDNEVIYTGKSLGYIHVREYQTQSSFSDNDTALTWPPSYATSANGNVSLVQNSTELTAPSAFEVVIDRNRGSLTKAEFFSCITFALFTVAQYRLEEAYIPFSAWPEGPGWDVSIKFEKPDVPIRAPVSWSVIVVALAEIANRAAEGRGGAKFAQLYGRIVHRATRETVIDWQLQLGRPVLDASATNVTLHGSSEPVGQVSSTLQTFPSQKTIFAAS